MKTLFEMVAFLFGITMLVFINIYAYQIAMEAVRLVFK